MVSSLDLLSSLDPGVQARVKALRPDLFVPEQPEVQQPMALLPIVQPEQSRTIGTHLADFGYGLLSGAISGVGAVGGTGREYLGQMLGDKEMAAAGRAYRQQANEQEKQYALNLMSPKARNAATQSLSQTTASIPEWIAMRAASTIPEMVATGVLGGGVGAIAKAAGKVLPAVVQYSPIEAGLSALHAGGQFEDEIQQTPHEQLMQQSPDYVKKYEATNPLLSQPEREAKAKESLADEHATRMGLTTGAATYAGSLLAGAGIWGALAHQAEGFVAGAVKGAFAEAREEGLQGVLESVVGDINRSISTDPTATDTTKLLANAAQNALEGAVVGGAVGGLGGAAGHVSVAQPERKDVEAGKSAGVSTVPADAEQPDTAGDAGGSTPSAPMANGPGGGAGITADSGTTTGANTGTEGGIRAGIRDVGGAVGLGQPVGVGAEGVAGAGPVSTEAGQPGDFRQFDQALDQYVQQATFGTDEFEHANTGFHPTVPDELKGDLDNLHVMAYAPDQWLKTDKTGGKLLKVLTALGVSNETRDGILTLSKENRAKELGRIARGYITIAEHGIIGTDAEGVVHTLDTIDVTSPLDGTPTNAAVTLVDIKDNLTFAQRVLQCLK